ncbi:hypothetical protein SAMN05444274_10899 [Mariniphaga anaerophila]|uniref:Uncharacterized protein n=1 Tax=Mariniphaga anaerophila TaxID=1484053 RepID=A0A1M5E636_9BACT|nr:hypothetical protein SAMN05444274_10899 [Mariniphaga anaerophila]
MHRKGSNLGELGFFLKGVIFSLDVADLFITSLQNL